VTDLGNLGGPAGTFGGNVASGINNQGQVVGNSDLPGDTTSHAFLWQNGVMKDLGVFGSDIASFALGINDRSEVVGIDLTESFGNRAVLWENGDAIDLNALIPPNSGLYLQLAEGINSFGQIVGFASVTSGPNAGEIHAFLATPVTGEPGGGYVSDAATASLVQRANARQLRRRP
jgi:probable HAF family extracellular repeat protein